MGIYKKLADIQKRLIAPKGQFNDYGKFNYRSCEDILKALKPLCEEVDCVCFITNDLVNIGDRNYVKATVKLVDLESGEELESVAHAREEENKKGMDGSQITGASSSYARKYALSGLFCIDNEKDSDATNEEVKEEKGKREEPKVILVDKVHISTMKKEMERTGLTEGYICKLYKVKQLEDFTIKQFNDAMEKFRNTKDKQ